MRLFHRFPRIAPIALTVLAASSMFLFVQCTGKQQNVKKAEAAEGAQKDERLLEHATFAMGCFWHSEEMFSEIKGVTEAVPGYAGGTEKNPSYELVGSGNTNYAESVEVTFDPAVVSYGKLLQVFFTEHDPTTPNYAAPDEGPQYRSIIFYHDAEQKKEAEAYIAKLTQIHSFGKPIITQVIPFTKFYQAEDYHLHYYRLHPDQPYIAGVTRPEVEKFRRDFPDLLQ